MPAVALLPAAVLALNPLSPSSSAPGQGSAERQTLGSPARERQRERERGWKRKDRERENISELRRLGQKRNRIDRAVCLVRRRTLGGLLKETGQCVKGEWKREGGRGRRRLRAFLKPSSGAPFVC